MLWVALALLSLMEIFLVFHFGTRMSPRIMQMILETNVSEAGEFFEAYCLDIRTVLMGLLYFVIVLFPIAVNGRLGWLLNRKAVRWLFLAGIIMGFVLIGFDVRAHVKRKWWDFPFYEERITTVDTLIYSWQAQKFSTDLPILLAATHCFEADPQVTCDYISSKIILIIGESFNKYHSSLYGYGQRTNPRLERWLAEGNLAVFDDVLSPNNYTSYVLKRVYSLRSEDMTDCNIWNDAPIFPTVFHRCGYRNTLISNQNVKKTGDNFEYSISYYLNNDSIERLSFDRRNDQIYKYDEQVVDAYADWLSDPSPNQLVILHLMGQHAVHSQRYPESWDYFAADSVNRPDLDDGQRRKIAVYDNATRYNDYVIDRVLRLNEDQDAVVVYFSDHGEEVNDFRLLVGRSHDTYMTRNFVKYQFEIPFLIWMSDRYKKSHPKMVQRIAEAVHRPFMIDDMCHLLFDLAGIRCKWSDSSRSPINDVFQPRKRLLREGDAVYEELSE